jgi:perosamine synthetase
VPVDRDHLLQGLLDRGIASRRGIMATHLEPAFAGVPHAELPVTERVARRSLILPLFHGMAEADIDRVAGAVRELATPHALTR